MTNREDAASQLGVICKMGKSRIRVRQDITENVAIL